MDSSEGKSSNFDRRSSLRHSTRLSNAAPSATADTAGVFEDDDDYDLSAMMVADGFRPTQNTASSGPSQQSSQPQPLFPLGLSSQSQSEQIPPSTPLTQPQPAATGVSPKALASMRIRPSSISKPPRNPHDSLALRNDGSSTAAAGQAGVSRMSSLSSDSPVIRLESPYRGPSGPSHPYQMYPQRTMSIVTTSTETTATPTPERSYNGPRGPTHPYALYAQNTVPNGDTAPGSIPLGFNGMADSYQRQLGPDGEEAGDLIGPLGHMEELPPYTRYPENSFVPKDPHAAAPVAVVSNEPPSPAETIPGAGGIGRATRNPEFSTDDLVLSRSHGSVRSNRSSDSHHDINVAGREFSEKANPSKWRRRAEKKLWGIVPYWAICLLVVGLVLMGIIMGSVIGTILSKHHKKQSEDNDQMLMRPSPTTADVIAFQTVPADLSPMATGSYGVPPLDVNQSPKGCFKESTQTQAWSCDVPFTFYKLEVDCVPGANPVNNYQLSMTPMNRSDQLYTWGTQPPHIPQPLGLSLVNDTYEPSRGPAWWLKLTYNKTVVIDQNSFSAATKRSTISGWDVDAAANYNHRYQSGGNFGPQDGNTAWICTWPETTLEIFIYPEQNSSVPLPTSTSTTTMPPPPTSVTWTVSPSQTAPPHDFPSLYPKLIKVMEKRLADNAESVASCAQVVMINGATATQAVLGSDGKPIQVVIEENPQSWDSDDSSSTRKARSLSQRWQGRDLFPRDNGELTSCGCLWWSV